MLNDLMNQSDRPGDVHSAKEHSAPALDFGLELLTKTYAAGGAALSPTAAAAGCAYLLYAARSATFWAVSDTLRLSAMSASAQNAYIGSMIAGAGEWRNNLKLSHYMAVDASIALDKDYVKRIDEVFGFAPVGRELSASNAVEIATSMFFTAGWKAPFDPSRTEKRSFHTADGEFITNMMSYEGDALYSKGEGFALVALPFGDIPYTCLLLLPDKALSSPGEFDVDGAAIISAMTGLDTVRAAVSVPKISLEGRLQLAPPLSDMGMPLAFTPDANLSKLAVKGKKGAYVTSFEQDVRLCLDENGVNTENRAEVAETAPDGQPGETIGIAYDRPFLLIVYDVKFSVPIYMAWIGEVAG